MCVNRGRSRCLLCGHRIYKHARFCGGCYATRYIVVIDCFDTTLWLFYVTVPVPRTVDRWLHTSFVDSDIARGMRTAAQIAAEQTRRSGYPYRVVYPPMMRKEAP